MPELLSSASLLLAALGFLYNAWRDDIRHMLDLDTSREYLDLEPEHKRLKAVLYWKSGSLALASAAMTLILLPEFYRISSCSAKLLFEDPVSVWLESYDAVRATVLLVTVAFAVLTIHLGLLARRLTRKYRLLSRIERKTG